MKKLITALCLILSPLTYAAEKTQAINGGIGWGITEVSGNGIVDDPDAQLHYDLSYRYKFDDQWEIELGYMKQDVLLYIPFNAENQLEDVYSYRTAMLYSIPLSQRNKLFAKLGAAHYSINAIHVTDNFSSNDHNGVGLVAGLGWRYEYDSGIEHSLVYTYQDFDIISSHTLTFNLGYRF
jgi:opacity protein-like surface antigen